MGRWIGLKCMCINHIERASGPYGAIKIGFLFIQSPEFDGKWIQFFVALNAHSLVFYERGSKTPKGDILFTSETTLDMLWDQSVRIRTRSEIMSIRGYDMHDTKDWMASIREAVTLVATLARGYFVLKKKRQKSRVFVMLHHDCITVHPSHNCTHLILEVFPLSVTSAMKRSGAVGLQIFDYSGDAKSWLIDATDSTTLFNMTEALDQVLRSIKATSGEKQNTLVDHRNNNHNHHQWSGVLAGRLLIRSYEGKWIDCPFVLTENSIYQYDLEGEALRHCLSPATVTASTTLNKFAFQVVTDRGVLHLAAMDSENRTHWLSQIRRVVAEMTDSESCIGEQFYDVAFQSPSAPGVIMIRMGESAVVNRVTPALRHSIPSGSVLVGIDGDDITTESFNEVMAKLAKWKPPLMLRFREPRIKTGWIGLKDGDLNTYDDFSSDENSKLISPSDLEMKYVEQRGAELLLYCDASCEADTAITLSLHGSAVVVEPTTTNTAECCFMLIADSHSQVFQVSNENELMEWITSIVTGASLVSSESHHRMSTKETALSIETTLAETHDESSAYYSTDTSQNGDCVIVPPAPRNQDFKIPSNDQTVPVFSFPSVEWSESVAESESFEIVLNGEGFSQAGTTDEESSDYISWDQKQPSTNVFEPIDMSKDVMAKHRSWPCRNTTSLLSGFTGNHSDFATRENLAFATQQAKYPVKRTSSELSWLSNDGDSSQSEVAI
mmetsp:Transcript_30815/g.47221  ORF Transcript_30815/g.47221 Transcript_30815/m.47221 type:complete len:724 (+) Transcript_30815:219-2390(+)